MIEAIFNYTFVQNALLAALFGSLVCGIIGTIIVEKRLVSMTGGIAHTSFGGIGIGYFLGIEPIITGLMIAIVSSLGIAHIHRSTNTRADTLIGMFWSVGMAIGIIFIAFTPGYPPDMTSYLFGDILTVSTTYVRLMMLLSIVIVFAVTYLFNYLKAFLFDEEFAKVLGLPIQLLENVMYILIALSIVILIKVVGIILVIALLTIPPATAKLFTFDLKNTMILSSVLGVIFCLLGLNLSYQFNIPSGATIILLSVIGYFLALILHMIRKHLNE